MNQKDSEIWNQEALRALKSKPPLWFSYYIGNSYRKAVEKGLKHVTSEKVVLLKTDLWNEGIEVERDILGPLEERKNFDLYGIDISPVVCSYAKARLKKVNIVQGDIRNLPFKDNFFDIVFDLSTLDHLPENQALKVLQEYTRVIKKGGVLVLIFWYKSSFLKYILKRIRKREEPQTQYYFLIESIRNEIKKSFEILEEYSTGILLCVPYLGFILDKLPKTFRNLILNLVLRLEYSKASKYILKNFAGLYVIIGKKPMKKTVEEMKSYWDQRIKKAGDSWEGVLWEKLPLWNKYIDELQMHYLKNVFSMIKPTDIVLDLGCGVGRFTFRIANLSQMVYGVDSSKHAIDVCIKKARDNGILNTKFEVMDARKLNFDDETFDWVLSVTCLQCITDLKDLTTAIQEALRVTKKTGKIILLECTSDKRKDGFVISLPREHWFEIIEKAGGKIEDWYGVDLPFFRKIIFPFLQLTTKIRNEKIKKILQFNLISLLKPFEYTIPKIWKNQSWYTVVIISKRDKSNQ